MQSMIYRHSETPSRIDSTGAVKEYLPLIWSDDLKMYVPYSPRAGVCGEPFPEARRLRSFRDIDVARRFCATLREFGFIVILQPLMIKRACERKPSMCLPASVCLNGSYSRSFAEDECEAYEVAD